MAPITNKTLGAFLAFGTASIAVADVTELGARVQLDGAALDLLVELEDLHTRLRALFADGHDDAVRTVAENVVVLDNRTTDAILEITNRSGD